MRTFLLHCFAVCTLFGMVAFAQTNPTPFDLSSGSYSFTQWDNTNAAGTFPPNMRFHMYSTTSSLTAVEPLVLNYDMNSDWDAAYNVSSGARIIGSGVDGVSFLNTSSSIYSPTRFFGAAVVALNTTNRVNIRVNWVGGTVVSQTRLYAVVLQYRVGTTDAWSTAIQNGTDTIQYKSSTTGNSQSMPTFTLPSTCENQPVVQLRWRYYQYSSAAPGSRPQLRVDEIAVQSDASSGVPTKLKVLSVVPSIPSAQTPFSITVQTLNDSNQVRSVTQATAVQLNLVSGTGSLSGTLTGTIAANSNTATLSGLTYSVAQSGVKIAVSRTSGDVLSPDTTAAITVLPRAVNLSMSTVQPFGFVGVALNTITVTAQRSDLSTDLNYPGPVSLSKVSGPGNVTGTLTQNPVNGVVTFSDVSFEAAGSYVITVTGPNINAATSGTIQVVAQPTVAELVMPQYMAARSITLPSWALIRFDGLQPNTAYRYYTAAAEINNLVGFAAGTNVHYNAPANTFSYVPASFSDFGTPGRYSEFATGAGETSKTLWVNMVPSSNSRFTAGNNMYWYITFRDTTRSIETRFVTNGTTKTINISTAAGDATGISDTASTCDPKTVICLYDNDQGTGSPLSTAMVQDDGTSIDAAPVFYTNIDAKRTAWATLIPNSLASGVRRVEERSITTGNVIKAWIDDDGIWTPVSTINPRGGNNAIIFPTPQVQFPVSLNGTSFCSISPAIITWTERGIATVDLQVSTDNGATYSTIAAGVDASLGTYSWNIPANFAGGNNLRLRIVDTQRPTTVFDVSGYVNINTPATITKDPESIDACLGGSASLTVQADGSSLSYQWEKDGHILSGQTGPVMTITNVNQASSGLYRCLVNGGSGCPGTSSKYAVISILPQLEVLNQPKSIAIASGATALLSVEVSLQKGSIYQWYMGSTPLSDNARISGSNSSTLTIRLVGSSDYANNYHCRITTMCGSITSADASISDANIAITDQPQSLHGCPGGDATFVVSAHSATGSALSYQWYLNNKKLSDGATYTGTTTSILVVHSAGVNDTGSYQCLIKAANGALGYSSVASFQLGTAPSITSLATSTTACAEMNDTLNVAVDNQTDVNYQWFFGSNAISGATDAQYVVTVTDQSAGSYHCVVSNACGSDTSAAYAVAVQAATVITTQPRALTTRPLGSAVVLDLVATGSNLHFQWYHNGVALLSNTTETLSIVNAAMSDSGRYVCIVSGDCGEVVSDTAVVIIDAGVGVDDIATIGFGIRSNHPNPAKEQMTISFETSSPRNVQLRVSDFLGRPVGTVFSGFVGAGAHDVVFQCDDLASGTYYLELESENHVVTRRVAIVH